MTRSGEYNELFNPFTALFCKREENHPAFAFILMQILTLTVQALCKHYTLSGIDLTVAGNM
jgi:hypothetical protein